MSTGMTPDAQRVVVDPNRVSRAHPGWLPVMLDELTQIPTVGERVTAVQPDEHSGCDFVGRALVRAVDRQAGLVFLEVDWSSFADEVAVVPADAGMRKKAYVRWTGGIVNLPRNVGNTARRGRVKVA